jgi:hypothetical protein
MFSEIMVPLGVVIPLFVDGLLLLRSFLSKKYTLEMMEEFVDSEVLEAVRQRIAMVKIERMAKVEELQGEALQRKKEQEEHARQRKEEQAVAAAAAAAAEKRKEIMDAATVSSAAVTTAVALAAVKRKVLVEIEEHARQRKEEQEKQARQQKEEQEKQAPKARGKEQDIQRSNGGHEAVQGDARPRQCVFSRGQIPCPILRPSEA